MNHGGPESTENTFVNTPHAGCDLGAATAILHDRSGGYALGVDLAPTSVAEAKPINALPLTPPVISTRIYVFVISFLEEELGASLLGQKTAPKCGL